MTFHVRTIPAPAQASMISLLAPLTLVLGQDAGTRGHHRRNLNHEVHRRCLGLA